MRATFAVRRRSGALASWTALALASLSPACSDYLLKTSTEANFDRSPAPEGQGGAGEEPEGLSCEGAENAPLLSLPQFGESEPLAAPLWLGGNYQASQGPGLFVVTKDAFRLFVNGELVLSSTEARKLHFLPLNLLPGENVIALALAAGSSTPAALVHLDELSAAYVSDSTWKVSQAPGEGFQHTEYDDSSWQAARELAQLGELPGCDPDAAFPRAGAEWIGSALGSTEPIVLRKKITLAPLGFGEAARGGEGETPQLVNSWEELSTLAAGDEPKLLLLPEGVHDYRRTGAEISQQEVCPKVCENDDQKYEHQVLLGDDTCAEALVMLPRNERILRIGSNTTLVGLGRGAALRGVTLDFQASEDVVVRNLAIFDVNPHIIEAGDAFGLLSPKRVWVDHATTQWVSDGFFDFRDGSTDITLSHLYMDGKNEFDCYGMHPRASTIGQSEVTIHHSRFDFLRTTAPRVLGDQSRVHLFNNSYSNLLGWALSSDCGANVLAEGNIFENVEAISQQSTCGTDTSLGYLTLPPGSNLYRDGAPVFLGGDGSEPQSAGFSPPYDYTAERASDAWSTVVSRAGTGGPWGFSLTLD